MLSFSRNFSAMVSIIIPHYNRSVLLTDTVDSVITQTSNDWELIIVDDGSDEQEFEAIKLLSEKDSRIFVLKRGSLNKGPSACRNEGVAASKGKYLIFLDSDDLLESCCVTQRLLVMDKNPTLDMGIFLMKEFTKLKDDSSSVYNHLATNCNTINCFLEGHNPWAVTCPVWNKDFFIQCGGFDESLFYMEDPDLHVRALLEDGMLFKTFYEYPADCYYRVNFHDDTKKHFYENSIRYRIQFYKKTGIFISERKDLTDQYKNSFERGVVLFFNNFLLSRVNQFPALRYEFIEWINGSALLSWRVVFKVKVLSAMFRNDNIVFKKLRLKGLLTKLLMPKI